MRLKFVIFILAFSLLQQNSLTAQRRIAISMHELSLDDPIFGISYLPAIVHYEQMPTRIRTLCQGFEDGQYWTFAHYQSGASEYFVVMGISRGQSGDSLGVAVQIKGKKCQTDDSEGMLSGHFSKSGYIKDATSDQLPGHNAPNVCPDGPSGSCYYFFRSKAEEMILDGLVADAIQRAMRAYGSEGQFMKKACTVKTIDDSSTTPIVQKELQRFCLRQR